MPRERNRDVPPAETSSLVMHVMLDHAGERVYVAHKRRIQGQAPVEAVESFPMAEIVDAIDHARHVVAMFAVEVPYQTAFPW